MSSYLVLTGVWYALALLCCYLVLRDPGSNAAGGILAAIVPAVAISVWLRGFELRVLQDRLVYRDGFRQAHEVPFAAIGTIKHTWVDPGGIGGGVQLPRLVITGMNRSTLLIVNSKVFGLDDLREVVSVIQRYSGCEPATDGAG